MMVMMLMLVVVVVVSEDYDNVNLHVRHEMVPLRQVGSGHRLFLLYVNIQTQMLRVTDIDDVCGNGLLVYCSVMYMLDCHC